MPLKKNMTLEEKGKICKLKPSYEETYKKGTIADDIDEITNRLKKEGSFVEVLKHGNLDNGIEAITVKIYFNS